MRFDRLELRKFGPFDGETLELSTGKEGLHLIYGANEAGKSSLLRAFRQLLFRFDSQTIDNWRFEKNDVLRLAAKLRSRDGRSLEVVRRKGNKNDLRAGNDSDVVPESDLIAFMGGIDKETFHNAYGIDAVRLRAGGQALLEGKGEAGATLFAARSGIAGVKAVIAALQGEADEIYKAKGRTQKFSLAKANYKQQLQNAAGSQLKQDDWFAAQKASSEAKDRRDSIGRDIERERVQLARLERLRDTQPLLAKRDRAAAELAEFADVPSLPDDFTVRRIKVEEELRQAEIRETEIRTELAGVDAERSAIVVDEGLLDHRLDVERVRNRRSQHDKEVSDRTRETGRMQNTEHEAREILRDLKLEPDLDPAKLERYRPAADLSARITRLSQRQGVLLTQQADAERSIAESTFRETEARRQLKELPAAVDAAPLRVALASACKQISAVDSISKIRLEIDALCKQQRVRFKQLGGFAGDMNALLEIAAPADESIDHFERELEQAARILADAETAVRDTAENLARLESDLKIRQVGRETPTPADLESGRATRDSGWRLVRAKLLQSGVDAADVQRFMESQGGGELPDAFEKSVGHADRIADRMREHADVVLEVQKTSLEIARQMQLLAERRERQVEVGTRHEKLLVEWKSIWEPLGVTPKTPREMRAWVRQYKELSDLELRRREREAVAEEVERSIEAERVALTQVLRASGIVVSEPASLAALIGQCEMAIAGIESAENARTKLRGKIAESAEEIRKANERLAKTNAELAIWSTQWAEAIAPLGLPEDADIDRASHYLESLREVFEKASSAKVTRSRIEGMDRNIAGYRKEVSDLIAVVAKDLAERPLDHQVEELDRRLAGAGDARLSLQNVTETQRKLHAERDVNGKRLEQLRSQLQSFCTDAGAAAPEALPRIEGRARLRAQFELNLRGLDEQLTTTTAGFGGIEFLEEARSVSQPDLAARVAELLHRIGELEQQRSQADQDLGERRRIFAELERDAADANDAIERAEQELAAMREHARQFAILRTASLALQAGIERYRDRNQTPVLERACKFFSKLTLQNFSGLRAELGDSDVPELFAVRGDEKVEVNGLSDGTADQLFLALRLATILTALDDPNREPMPFIVDDLLLTFDDDRAVAALEALAELSKKTQVLFLTHHRHLVDLAKSRLADDVLFCHQLR